MCLYNPKQVTLDKDLVCYKVVHYDVETGKYISPFTHPGTYTIGRTRSLNGNKLPKIEPHGLFKIPAITGGALHTLLEPADAVRLAKSLLWQNLHVIECVIPKDSKFVYEGYIPMYKSKELSHATSYASQKVKPVRVVFHVFRHEGKYEVKSLI